MKPKAEKKWEKNILKTKPSITTKEMLENITLCTFLLQISTWFSNRLHSENPLNTVS